MAVTIRPALLPGSPLNIYLAQVENVYGFLRTPKNLSFIPNQFGGTDGQAKILNERCLVESTSIQVVGNN